jgi:hypothetical protein
VVEHVLNVTGKAPSVLNMASFAASFLYSAFMRRWKSMLPSVAVTALSSGKPVTSMRWIQPAATQAIVSVKCADRQTSNRMDYFDNSRVALT